MRAVRPPWFLHPHAACCTRRSSASRASPSMAKRAGSSSLPARRRTGQGRRRLSRPASPRNRTARAKRHSLTAASCRGKARRVSGTYTSPAANALGKDASGAMPGGCARRRRQARGVATRGAGRGYGGRPPRFRRQRVAGTGHSGWAPARTYQVQARRPHFLLARTTLTPPPRAPRGFARYATTIELTKLANIKDTPSKERPALFIEKVGLKNSGFGCDAHAGPSNPGCCRCAGRREAVGWVARSTAAAQRAPRRTPHTRTGGLPCATGDRLACLLAAQRLMPRLPPNPASSYRVLSLRRSANAAHCLTLPRR